jgi:hypothetical protein
MLAVVRHATNIALSRRGVNTNTITLMKPRHAAALALVGWYLMMPMIMSKESESDCPPDSIGTKTSPSNCGQHHYITFREHVDSNAPLSKWSIAYFTDSMWGCKAFLDKYKAKSYGNRGTGADRKRSRWRRRWVLVQNALRATIPASKEMRRFASFNL